MEKDFRTSFKKMIINDKCVNECVVLINGKNDEKITVDFVDFFTEKMVATYCYDNSEKLVDGILCLFERKLIKAVILNVFKLQAIGFKNNVDFCNALKKKFDLFCYPLCFLSSYNYKISRILVGANVEMNEEETTILFNIFEHKIVVGELTFSNGYEYSDFSKIPDIGDDALITTSLFEVIFVKFQRINKIILFAESPGLPLMKKMQEIFEPMAEKLAIMEGSLDQYNSKFCVETAKWVYDRDEIKFYSKIKSARHYCIKALYGPNKSKIILHVDAGESLPFCQSAVLSCLPVDYFFGYYDHHNFVILKKFKLEPSEHLPKITLEVETNNFPSYEIHDLILTRLDELNATLNAELESKIPVITLFGNSSFISVHNGQRYEFLEFWKEIVGEKLFISFDEENPKFGEDALEVYKTKPSTVIFDITTILAQNHRKIRTDMAWGFTVLRDETNQTLFEFDDFDGSRRKENPKFLLGLLIERYIKAIENECGKEPTAVCFNLVNPCGNEFVMKHLEEACESLKIECSFFEDY